MSKEKQQANDTFFVMLIFCEKFLALYSPRAQRLAHLPRQ